MFKCKRSREHRLLKLYRQGCEMIRDDLDLCAMVKKQKEAEVYLD